MLPPPLIGLTGKKRSGKDTVADRLVSTHGYTRFAFADIMKEMLLRIDPWVQWSPVGNGRLSRLVDLVGWERAKEEPEVRRLLQALGTEAGRALFGESFWIDRTFAQIAEFHSHGMFPPRPVVITDVRFKNEADAVRAAGGLIVRLVRPDVVSSDTHPSETDLDRYDYDEIIYNAYDLAALHRHTDLLIDERSTF